MKLLLNTKQKNGFTLLYAVLVVGALMSLVFATLNIVYKQAALSNLTKNSAVAFYAADSGMECGRYWSAYGAFNTANPAIAQGNFSNIDCAGNASIAPLASASLLLGNPIGSANTDPSFPVFNPFSFSYGLSNVYSGLSNAPQTQVSIWQNQQFIPDPNTPFLTTAVLSTGANNNNSNDPLRVQRGVGTQAAVTQCMASAFTHGLAPGGYGQVHGSVNLTNLAPLVTPFFPGLSISTAAGWGGQFGNKNGQGVSNPFPYLISSLAPADGWAFNPLVPTPLNLEALFIKVPSDGSAYAFGFYPVGSTNPIADFQTISTSTNGVEENAPVAMPPNASTQYHFALEISDSSGNITLWSTNYTDNLINNNPVQIDTSHVAVFAVPMPGVTNSPLNHLDAGGNNTQGGKYLFAFDTNSSLNPATYSSVVVLLKLVGCP